MDDHEGHAEDLLVSAGARRFVAALRAIEDRGEVEEMAGLGTDTTTWWSTGTDRTQNGAAGARRFWESYRRAFAEISSEFTAVTETPARVVLEWTGRGRHHSKRPVSYTGATVIELDERDGEQPLTATRLYYDTAAALTALPAGSDAPDGERDRDRERDDDRNAVSMLDRETAASGSNSGLAPGDDDASQ